jgi:uncharacterized protein (UPF0332 family)
MNEYARELWQRATKALSTAQTIVGADPDAAASRAYYAAFFAVSALFASEAKEFVKHAAVEAAVHRDLVKPGRWPAELGQDYHTLVGLRATGDYGGLEHVEPQAALRAVDKAQRILDAVIALSSGLAAPDDA